MTTGQSSLCDSVSLCPHIKMIPRKSNTHSHHQKSRPRALVFEMKVLLFSLIICGLILPITSYEIWSIYFDDMRPSMSKDGRTRSQLFEVPFAERRHMFELATYINVSNEQRIRRMELSLCEEVVPASARKLPTGSLVINPENGVTYTCVQRIASLLTPMIALNSTIVRFPQDVGLPLDKNEPDSRALLLMIEYTQDHNLLQDNSGFDLYLSDETLPIEAGVMAVGLMPDRRFILPPNINGWTTKGTCFSSCFDYKMEHNEFAVAAIIPSVNHLSLNELTLEVSAFDGTSRKIFAWGGDTAIDMSQEPLIKSSDQLEVRCNFRASNKSILGGLGEGDENCLVWLHYYPKMNIDACLSSYSAGTVMSLLDSTQLNATTGETGLNLTVEGKQLIEFVEDKDRINGWNLTKLARSRFSVAHGRQVPQCGWKWHHIVPELRRR